MLWTHHHVWWSVIEGNLGPPYCCYPCHSSPFCHLWNMACTIIFPRWKPIKGFSVLKLYATSIVRTAITVYNTAGRRHLVHCVLPSMQSSLAPSVCAADSQNALRSPLVNVTGDVTLAISIGWIKVILQLFQGSGRRLTGNEIDYESQDIFEWLTSLVTNHERSSEYRSFLQRAYSEYFDL